MMLFWGFMHSVRNETKAKSSFNPYFMIYFFFLLYVLLYGTSDCWGGRGGGGGSDVAIATIGLDSIIMLLMWFLLLAMPLVLLLMQLWLLLMLSGTVRLKAWIFLSFFVAVDGVEDGSNNDLVCVVWKQKFFKINA